MQGFLSFDNGLVRLIGSGGGARDTVRRETSRSLAPIRAAATALLVRFKISSRLGGRNV
jgi:hypothetical protein